MEVPMSSIQITLPDGSMKTVEAGSRPIDIAQSIGSRLAGDAIVAKVNGEMVDLTRPIESDARLEILTPKDPAALQVYRHSTAHLLAAAVLELYPETQLGIGRRLRTASITISTAPRPSRRRTWRRSKRRCGRSRRGRFPMSAC